MCPPALAASPSSARPAIRAQVYGTLTAGSTNFVIIDGALTSADIGKVLVAVGAVSGTPTAFESAVASISDSLHGVLDHAGAVHPGHGPRDDPGPR